jgi:hypothetical protein
MTILNPFTMKKKIVELQRLSEKQLNDKLSEIYVGKYKMEVDDIVMATMIQQIITTKRIKSEGL